MKPYNRYSGDLPLLPAIFVALVTILHNLIVPFRRKRPHVRDKLANDGGG